MYRGNIDRFGTVKKVLLQERFFPTDIATAEKQNAGNRSAINHHPLTTTPDISLQEALGLMQRTRTSCLLVLTDDERNSPLIGLLTERDVVRLAASGVDWSNVSLASVMTTQLITITETEAQDIFAVLSRLRQHQIRHLPVVGEAGNLVGIITSLSLRDILQPVDLLRLKQVSEVMSPNVVHAPGTASLLELAQLMTKEHVSCVVIVEEGESGRVGEGAVTTVGRVGEWDNFSTQIHDYQQSITSGLRPATLSLKLRSPHHPLTPSLIPVGIVTECDIVQSCNLGLELAHTQAATVMTTPLLPIQPTDSIWSAHQLMQEHGVQRLVVSGAAGELVGIITQTGVLEAISPIEIYQTVETLQHLVDEQTSELRQLNQQFQEEIRKRQLLEEKLHTSEAKIRAVFEAMSDIVLILNLQGDQIKDIEVIPTSSSALYEPGTDLIGKTIKQFFQNKTEKTWIQKARQALDQKQTLNFDYSLLLKEQQIWFSASISPISDTSVVWVARDISDRKHSEEVKSTLIRCLQQNEHRLSQIVSSVSESLIIQDKHNQQVLFANAAATALFDRRYEELLGTSLGKPIISDESTDVEIIHRAGKSLVAEMRTVDIIWENQAAYLISLRDVTERKRAEEALRESEECFKSAFDYAAIGMALVAPDGRWLKVNRSLCEIVGYSQQELLTKTFQDITHPDDLNIDLNYVHQMLNDEIRTYQMEMRYCHKAGHIVWVLLSASLVRNRMAQPLYFIAQIQDISDAYLQATQRKKAEECLQQSEAKEREKAIQLELTLNKLKRAQAQLIQAEKMSSLGQMVAGIAHEINNPVSFIYGNITPATEYAKDLLELIKLYRQHYPEPVAEISEQQKSIDPDFIAQDFPKLLASMKEGASRISQIVLSLRNFSRLDEAQKKRVDIHEGIDNTLLILQHRLKQQSRRPEIQVIKEYGQLPSVECYPSQLNQVFMYILSNAIDALDEARGKEAGFMPRIWIRTKIIKSASRVVIRITDNGCGIQAEVLPKIFDPFFTTKPVGSGQGLGLSISYQILVSRHGGQLKCYSTPGQGTEFAIALPAPVF
jgi:PAS domain S-box-containing protein